MKPHHELHEPFAEHLRRRGPGPRRREGEHDRGRGRGGRGHGGPDGHGGPHERGARGRGFGRPGGWQQKDVPDAADAPEWFAGRLPVDWFDGAATVELDREEIIVTGTLPAEENTSAATADGMISRFREGTRDERIRIATEAEARYGRKVAWAVRVGENTTLFTSLAVPVMTRLRQPERKVLDTLVDAGVARSRADALAWAVRLTGEHIEPWLAELREAMTAVDDLRAKGPQI